MAEQNNQIVTFNYEGTPISFNRGDAVMVNATEMAKPFGKRPVDWLNNQQTNDFINELSKVRNLTLADLVIVTRGGNNPGTWMHEDVAMEFARWLSPKFAIWCNDRIKELLTTGVSVLPNFSKKELYKRLYEQEEELEQLAAQNKQQTLLIEQKDNEIRTILIDEQPWFVGKDVAERLGYADTFGAINKHVDEEDKQNCQNSSFESPRGMTIINQRG